MYTIQVADAELLKPWQVTREKYKKRKELIGNREKDTLSRLAAFSNKLHSVVASVGDGDGDDGQQQGQGQGSAEKAAAPAEQPAQEVRLLMVSACCLLDLPCHCTCMLVSGVMSVCVGCACMREAPC